MDPEPTPLALSLARRLVDDLRAGAVGDLTERRLAGRFRVSRSPVRRALRLLAEAGVLAEGPRGWAVADLGAAAALGAEAGEGDEAAYRRIADDRLAGRLPDRISESALLRRYDVSRARLSRLLRRMAAEGWAERLPGHGWAFLPVLTSIEAYEDSLRFRLLIEPAALLEPRWTPDRPALEARRAEQAWLAGGAVLEVAGSRLFDLNSGMHEALMACCQNAFLIESLRRVDRLRRLIDYAQALDREAARGRCVEHVAILDLALAGRLPEASEAMRRHLGDLRPLKALARGDAR